jgi:hypothetical protein
VPISIRFERFTVFHTSTSGGGHDFLGFMFVFVVWSLRLFGVWNLFVIWCLGFGIFLLGGIRDGFHG